MDQRLNVTHLKSVKSPKLLALIALLIVLLFCFVFQIVSHQKKVYYAHKALSLPKLKTTATEAEKSNHQGWTMVKAQKGDSLASVFKRVGLNRQILQKVLKNNKYAQTLAKIKPDQQLQFLIKDEVLEKLIFPISTAQFLVVAREKDAYSSKVQSRKMSSHDEYLTATVNGSLYGTAKRMNIPYKLIQQMTNIFNWEIDFIKDIRAGDQISMIYQAYYIDDKLVNTGDIIAVSYTNRGKRHQAIRHVNSAGEHEYFSPEGVSLKKAFSRYPIKFSHISSTYSLSRLHPILHYRRAHKGVDLAAAIGTPIYATGDGYIQIIDRHNGYGNMIKISHDKMYSSLYAHLLRFQKGLSKGTRVRRGQIIGYVGQTGLADGPHCHYEFHINNQPKNPSTVALPRSSPVSGREMSSFKANGSKLLAQLKLYEEGNLIAARKKSADTT